MIINHNLGAMNANRMMGVNQANANKSMEKLSSGLRINKAGDDAAGLAISEKMRGQIRGLDQASANAQDGISMIQTAEGALSETHSILQRMRELAVQSSTDTNTSTDRAEIQKEVDQLASEITRISNTTEFNTKNLLAGGQNSTFHIGANKDQNIQLQIGAMDAYSLGVAGQTVTLSGYAAGTSGVASVSEVGRGFATGTGYNIDVAVTAASYTTPLQDSSTTGTKDVGSGDVSINAATSYTGTQDLTYQVKVASKTSDNVSTVQVSTDNGATWGAAITLATGIADLGNGLQMTFTNGAAGGDYVVGDTYSFAVTAKYATLQLQDGSSNNIGSAAKVYTGATSAIIGDPTADKTMKASFAFGSLTNAQSATFNLTANTSKAATTTATGDIATNGDAKALAGISVNTQASANTAVTTIQKAIETVSAERSKLGAYQNRLEHTIANLGTSSENLTSAESRIRDVNMAKEMSTFSKNNILSQAAQAMLAQANQQPQQVLQLLR